jgi:hypothetical protein
MTRGSISKICKENKCKLFMYDPFIFASICFSKIRSMKCAGMTLCVDLRLSGIEFSLVSDYAELSIAFTVVSD